MSSESSATSPPPLLPVGIDLGSLHARIAAGDPVERRPPASSPPPGEAEAGAGAGAGGSLPSLPSVVRNAQGGRHTLAASAAEFDAHNHGGEAAENGDKDQKEGAGSYVFGEAARQSLHRARKPLERSLVRHLSSLGVDGDDDNDGDEGGGDAEKEAEAEEAAESGAARSASSAFFAHLSQLVCDASSVRPSQLRVVLNAPAGADGRVVRGAVEAAERGLAAAVEEEEEKSAAGGKKKRRKKKGDDDGDDGRRVVGVLGDPAAVAVAHGLTGPGGGGRSAAPSRRWSHALVVDWGASSLTLSHLSNLGSTGALHLAHTARSAQCSGAALSALLVKHCASQFERKSRLPSGEVLASKRAKGRLERACEDALRTLGRAGGAGCSVVVDGLYEGMDLNVQVSRPRFDMLCGPLFRTARGMLEAEAKRLTDDRDGARFDAVVAAGNVSLMPGAVAVVDGLFPPSEQCWRGRTDVPPDEAVALGCALHCGYLLRSRAEYGTPEGRCRGGPETEDVPLCPVGIGVTAGGDDGDGDGAAATTLIEAGAPLPANVTRTIALDPPGSALSVVRLPPANDASASPKLLARIEDAPPDAAEVELTAELTAEGELTLAVNGGEPVTL